MPSDTSPPSQPAPGRRWRRPGVLLAAVLGLAVAVLTIREAWHHAAGSHLAALLLRADEGLQRWPAAVVVAAVAVLPAVGLPVTPAYLAAGGRFGPWGGIAVMAAATVFHLAVMHVVARRLRGPLERRLARRGHHVPEVPADEQAMVCVVGVLLPGLPYVVRNALLVLGGVRLGSLLLVAAPLHLVRALAVILLAGLGGDAGRGGLAALAAFEVTRVAVCGWVLWRLREHHRRFHPARKPPGPPGATDPEIRPPRRS